MSLAVKGPLIWSDQIENTSIKSSVVWSESEPVCVASSVVAGSLCCVVVLLCCCRQSEFVTGSNLETMVLDSRVWDTSRNWTLYHLWPRGTYDSHATFLMSPMIASVSPLWCQCSVYSTCVLDSLSDTHRCLWRTLRTVDHTNPAIIRNLSWSSVSSVRVCARGIS